MAKIDPALWRDMMDYLRRRHAPICRQWFENLRPVELDSGLLKIHTETRIQQNYLQKRCAEQFTEAAQAATGALVAVRFINLEGHNGGDGHERVGAAAGGASAGVGGATSASGGGGNSGGGVATAAAPVAIRGRSEVQVIELRSQGNDALEPDELLLSPDYTFDTFVTGPNNRLAYAAAVAVANQPGTAYNPLFIHGGVGLGKTHLLQAICQKILQVNPKARICYLSCDAFMNRFLDCVQSGKMNEFRNRYRHVDVLVIDDIHFLAKREQSQEEFFHTFNALYQSNRQLVLSSDSPPADIPQLEERLVSRFQWGLVAEVSKPAYETRVGIVRAKAKLRGIVLPDDVVSYIAAKIDSNARELEGAITTVQGCAALQDQEISLELAKNALGEPGLESRGSHQVTLQNIIDVVTEFYNVKLSDLQSKRRHKSITLPRQVCMWLARKRTRFSLQEIGGYFGGRDHTTVMHSIDIIEERMGADSNFGKQIEQLDGRLTSTK
ncbi:MAG: chromosomal replication initiator protein DnaA [Phycisphaeraceae bacterium]|nr:chromosomal replication initiator protein DnaA [Phycisphaeraceae bacterium]